MTGTQPIDSMAIQTASRLVIAPTWQDPMTKALYVHQDLVKTQEPWAEEAHIRPMKASESFGDVESFVDYVGRYSNHVDRSRTLLTWNKSGLRAVLDYANFDQEPGRCQWTASYPFITSIQWRAWMELADGHAVGQKAAIESLEDLSEDILTPTPAELMSLLRSLRASVNSQADTELRPDGTMSIKFSQDTKVKSGGAAGEVSLPPTIEIAIPVLKGHVNSEGRPFAYRVPVRVRVSVDDDSRLAFRFTVPTAERILEDAYADRVKAAKELLGENYTLPRAAN
jgi:uncharacterized protein YfdQ (DUF2303 family)